MTGVVLDRIAGATLRPDESRQVFRTVVDALSRPGRIVRLSSERSAAIPAVLLPVLSLADLGTGVAVLEDDDEWSEVIGVVTSAPKAPLSTARFVVATRTPGAHELRQACRGRALAPQDGALVCVSVLELDSSAVEGAAPAGGVTDAAVTDAAAIDLDVTAGEHSPGDGAKHEGAQWILSGPGIPGARALAGLDRGVVSARAEAVAGFPAGIDLLLIAPDGRMAGIPRTTVIDRKDA